MAIDVPKIYCENCRLRLALADTLRCSHCGAKLEAHAVLNSKVGKIYLPSGIIPQRSVI